MKGMSGMAMCFLEPTNVNSRNEKTLGAEGLSLRDYLRGTVISYTGDISPLLPAVLCYLIR